MNAQYNVGLAHCDGKGVQQDDAQAVHWWRKAAEQGHVNAQYGLGVAHSLGKGCVLNLRGNLWAGETWRRWRACCIHRDAGRRCGSLNALCYGL